MNDKRKSKDVLPVPIKTSNAVPMPTENDDVQRYAMDGKVSFGGKTFETKTENGKYYVLNPGDGQEWNGPFASEQAALKAASAKATDSKRAKDSLAKLPTQHAGSEPKDHMLRAAQYEVQGDRARALDSYRAAASGYRRSNDRAAEQKAREGVDACQAVFAQQYSHPAAGRVKVCDSAEAALCCAIERTRAGEAVRITDGRTVRPGRARAKDAFEGGPGSAKSSFPKHTFKSLAHNSPKPEDCEVCGARKEAHDDTNGPPPVDNPAGPDTPSPVPDAARDEHEGFKKLEGELSREKGVTDPAALAASIGRKKYGAEGMAKKSAAARDVRPV